MTENDQMRIAEARRSFTGKTLTDAQFDESWQLAGIVARGIRRTGTFKEKIADYAHAFARTEKFDAMKGETIIRDIFKARYGKSMNEMREALMEREAAVREQAKPEALTQTRAIEQMIRDGETMPFYRAYDTQARALSERFDITEAGAKSLMKESYREAEGRDLYETMKKTEETYHRPKVEAERKAREAAREAEAGPQQKMSYSR